MEGRPALNPRLRAATGWEPRIPLDDTLRDTLAWWLQTPAEGLEPPTP